MQLYKSNISVINAIQVVRYRLTNDELEKFVPNKKLLTIKEHHVDVHTVEGLVPAKLGDWIIHTAGKELIVMKNETFRALYVKVI